MNFILILQNISKIFIGFALTNVKNMKNQASFIYVIFPFGRRNVSPAKPNKLALKNTSLAFFGSYLRKNELHIIMYYYWYTEILLIIVYFSCIRRGKRLSRNINKFLTNFFGFS